MEFTLWTTGCCCIFGTKKGLGDYDLLFLVGTGILAMTPVNSCFFSRRGMVIQPHKKEVSLSNNDMQVLYVKSPFFYFHETSPLPFFLFLPELPAKKLEGYV